MTATAEIPAGWPNARFWSVALVIFAAQVGWIFLLGERFHPKPASPPDGGIVRMLSAPLDEEKWASYVFAVDPTVVPTSGSHGFADLAWHQLPANEYSAPLPKPAPFFLPFAAIPPALVVKPGGHPTLQIPSESASEMVEPVLETGGREASTFRLVGPLAGRQIAPPSSLPAWTNNNLLTNSVIHFGVNRAGQVFTGVLLEGSGLAEADQTALATVRDFRFRPSSKTAPAEVWDTANFYWRTVPPATNSIK